MTRQLILVVEDEPKIAGLVTEYLQQQGGFETAWLARGDEVKAWVEAHRPDLVLLDLMLPGMDGLEVCKQLRRDSAVPIIMLTARVEEIDRLLGLELGADDYICKPFSPREVVARVKAVLRRGVEVKAAGPAGLELDRSRFSAALNGQALNLTPVEFALLEALSAQPGRVFSREQLMDNMYSDYRVVNDRAVDTHIKNLRKKLQDARAEDTSAEEQGDGASTEMIESIYGIGYRFNP